MQFQLGDKWMELKGEDNGVLGQVALQSLFGKSFQVVDGLLAWHVVKSIFNG